MWILNFIPNSWIEFACLMILVIGAVMFFAGQIFKFIPFVRTYNFPLRLVGGLLLLAGAYLNGGVGVEMEYRTRIEEMQKKIEVAEAKSKQENVKIERIIQDGRVVIKQDTDATLAEIKRLKDELNSKCELTPEMIQLYNQGIGDKK